MDIQTGTTVAAVASAHPATIRVFQQHGIDFCCGGQRPLGEVCREHGLAFDALAGELDAAVAGAPPDERSWQDAPLDELVAHILARFHALLRSELPRLGQMMDKVLAVHGERRPELREVRATFAAIVADIEPHMMKEEQVLFPYVVQLAQAAAGGRPFAGSPFGTVRNPIRVMEAEHEVVAELLARLRTLTGGYAPPEDACNTYRGLYHGFAELERDTHEHIHLENNVLHPRAQALEESVLAGTGA